MMIIRQSQMEIFEEAALRRFESDMLVHLSVFAPTHCQVIGESAVRTGIRLGIQRAAGYGLSNRGPVRFFLELMFMYGCHFDTDPQHVWARDALRNEDVPDQMAKAEQLYAKAMAFTAATAGKDYVHAKDALRRARRVPFDDLPVLGGDFEATMLQRVAEMHPEKVQVLGEATTRSVIERCKALPEALSLAPERGAALCVAATFAVGHGFGQDPLLPWIGRTLTNPAYSDPEVRTRRLHARMMTYLDHVIAGFDAAVRPA
jgi:hypothetical protein